MIFKWELRGHCLCAFIIITLVAIIAKCDTALLCQLNLIFVIWIDFKAYVLVRDKVLENLLLIIVALFGYSLCVRVCLRVWISSVNILDVFTMLVSACLEAHMGNGERGWTVVITCVLAHCYSVLAVMVAILVILHFELLRIWLFTIVANFSIFNTFIFVMIQFRLILTRHSIFSI